MAYWEISLSTDYSFDSEVWPGGTEEQHREALERANEILEWGWDNCAEGEEFTMAIKLHEGNMPEEDYDGEE